jgi:hypothetical protein
MYKQHPHISGRYQQTYRLPWGYIIFHLILLSHVIMMLPILFYYLVLTFSLVLAVV